MAVSDKRLKLLEEFDTEMYCSIDALDADLNYIRYPARFDIIEKNLNRVLAADMTVRIIMTVSVFNIMSVIPLLEWARKQFSKYGRPLRMQVDHYVTKPEHLAPCNLPNDIKNKAIMAIERFLSDDSLENIEPQALHSLKSLIKFLKVSKGDPEIIRRDWSFVENYDRIRKNSWSEHAPWLKEVVQASSK